MINVTELIEKHDIDNIECALVQYYMEENKLIHNKNILLMQYVNKNNIEINNLKRYLKKEYVCINIKDVEKIFELLIPKNDRKTNGAYFTPSTITNYITTNLIDNKNQKICDPSCGCGAFLIASIDVLKDKFNKKVIDIIEQNIFAVDILDYCVRRCKIILSLIALQNGEDKEIIKFNIYTNDSLRINWKKLFPFLEKEGGFDIVIGNPPYVKFQDLSIENRRVLADEWVTLKTGTFNLYFAFYELGILLIKKSGNLGYITPNNYFTSLAGIHLREYLHYNRYIEKIIDFNHIKVFDSQTYTCVTFLSKKEKEFFLFNRIEHGDEINKLNNIKFSKIQYSSLNNRKWRLLSKNKQDNIRKIENIGKCLGEIIDIRVGIATCKDNIYFIDANKSKNDYYEKQFENNIYFIEPAVTKPITKISDFKNQKELEGNKRRIIFPYDIKNNKAILISKKELKQRFPNCFDYFNAVRDVLSMRDKGKAQYPEWYAYARTQGLTFLGQKLLTPTFSNEPRFLLEKNKESLFCNGYAIFLNKDSQDLFGETLTLKDLQKILNSKIMQYYIENTSVTIEGGYPCYQKNFIERFAIPCFDKKEIEYLRRESDLEKTNIFLIKKYNINI